MTIEIGKAKETFAILEREKQEQKERLQTAAKVKEHLDIKYSICQKVC